MGWCGAADTRISHFMTLHVYISISMATKSGKAKSKSRYTDIHTILEEIDRGLSQMEEYLLNGENIVLDW